jgi:hypothetical protein
MLSPFMRQAPCIKRGRHPTQERSILTIFQLPFSIQKFYKPNQMYSCSLSHSQYGFLVRFLGTSFTQTLYVPQYFLILLIPMGN